MKEYWSRNAKPGKRPSLRQFVEETEPSVQSKIRPVFAFIADNPEWQAIWDEVRREWKQAHPEWSGTASDPEVVNSTLGPAPWERDVHASNAKQTTHPTDELFMPTHSAVSDGATSSGSETPSLSEIDDGLTSLLWIDGGTAQEDAEAAAAAAEEKRIQADVAARRNVAEEAAAVAAARFALEEVEREAAEQRRAEQAAKEAKEAKDAEEALRLQREEEEAEARHRRAAEESAAAALVAEEAERLATEQEKITSAARAAAAAATEEAADLAIRQAEEAAWAAEEEAIQEAIEESDRAAQEVS